MARTRLGDLELTLRTFLNVKLYQELQFTPHLGTQVFHGMVTNILCLGEYFELIMLKLCSHLYFGVCLGDFGAFDIS